MLREANFAPQILAQEAIYCIKNRVWIKEILNYLYAIVTKKQFILDE
jgi:hypothetical protein